MRNAFLTVFLTCCLCFSVSCSRQPEEEPQVIRPVRYIQVFATGGERVRVFSGVSRAGIESRLSFKVAGSVEEVAVKVGDRVKKGQLIARLDDEIYLLQVQEGASALEQARAQMRRASSAYERVQQLYVNNNASKSDLDNARAGFESASAAVRTLEKKLDQARLQLSYTRLNAPIDGAISAVPVQENENVQAGMPVAILSSAARQEVNTAVPAALINHIKEGDTVTVTFDPLPEESFNATVTEVGVSSGMRATTYPVTVTLSNHDERVLSGMAAEVFFTLISADKRERFIVPSMSVASDGTEEYVFIARPAEEGFATVHRAKVTTGDLTADGIEIYSGLHDGDLVVTAGVSKIHDGLKVRLPKAGQ